MSRAWRVLVLLLVPLLTIMFALSSTSFGSRAKPISQSDRSGSSAIVREVMAVNGPEGWTSECGFDYCSSGRIAYVVAQSNGLRPRNVVVTVTLDLKTTGRDAAVVGAALHPLGSSKLRMKPGNHIVRSPLRSTSTLVWVASDVPTASSYAVEVWVEVRDSKHDNDDFVSATGRRVVTVVDLTE
jgi:hypothetical protein